MANNSLKLISRIFLYFVIFTVLGYFASNFYSEYSKYNSMIFIEFQNYRISTSLYFLIFCITILILLIFWFIDMLLSSIQYLSNLFFINYEKRYQYNKSLLLESAVLKSIGEMNFSKLNMDRINTKYLDDKEKDFFDLLRKLEHSKELSSETYYKLSKYPNFKLATSKYIAQIEFNLGNYDLAKKHALSYNSFNKLDKENNITIGKILFSQKLYSDFDLFAKGIFENSNFEEDYKYFSNIYLDIAREVQEYDQSEALEYYKSALIFDSTNYEAANIICNILASVKQINLLLEILIKNFSKKPSLEIFKLIYKYGDFDNSELYNMLSSVLTKKDSEIKMAIAGFLGLHDEITRIYNSE